MLSAYKSKENVPPPNEQCRLSLGLNVEAAKMDEDNKVSALECEKMIKLTDDSILDLV